jgi:MFS family permease
MGDDDRLANSVMRWYFASLGLSMLGTGLWLPLNAIFLSEKRGLPVVGVGAYYAVTAFTAILATLVAGSVADRVGPFRPLAVAGVLQAVGVALLIIVDSRPGVYVAAVVCGAGNGTFFAVQTAAVTRIFGLNRLPTIFGRQYQITNIGIGAGSLVLGGLVHQLGYAGYVIGFSVNAASYAIHALNVVGPVRRMAIASGLAGPWQPGSTVRSGPLRPYRDRHFLPVILIQLCVVIFGYAQLDAVVPIVFRDSAHLPLWAVTVYTAANCVGVVLFQPWAIRWVKRVGPERGLRDTMLVWLVAIVPGLLARYVGGLLPKLLAVSLFAVVFAIGETLVSPSLQPMAAGRAPRDRLASYTAAVSVTFSVGLVVGPPVSLLVFGELGANVYWLLIAAGFGLGTLAVRLARKTARAEATEAVESEAAG